MKIIWTHLAKTTYFDAIDDLNKHWTKTEITNFITRTNTHLDTIKNGVVAHKSIYKKIRKCIIHKNISLYYTENKADNEIILIVFYNNKMNPKTLLKLLNRNIF